MEHNSLRWFRHVLKNDDPETVRIVMEMNIEIRTIEEEVNIIWNTE